jgi:hypothetical protein
VIGSFIGILQGSLGQPRDSLAGAPVVHCFGTGPRVIVESAVGRSGCMGRVVARIRHFVTAISLDVGAAATCRSA